MLCAKPIQKSYYFNFNMMTWVTWVFPSTRNIYLLSMKIKLFLCTVHRIKPQAFFLPYRIERKMNADYVMVKGSQWKLGLDGIGQLMELYAAGYKFMGKSLNQTFAIINE